MKEWSGAEVENFIDTAAAVWVRAEPRASRGLTAPSTLLLPSSMLSTQMTALSFF